MARPPSGPLRRCMRPSSDYEEQVRDVRVLSILVLGPGSRCLGCCKVDLGAHKQEGRRPEALQRRIEVRRTMV